MKCCYIYTQFHIYTLNVGIFIPNFFLYIRFFVRLRFFKSKHRLLVLYGTLSPFEFEDEFCLETRNYRLLAEFN